MRKDFNPILNCYTPSQEAGAKPYMDYYYATGYIGNCCGSFNAISWEEFMLSTFGITIFVSDKQHKLPPEDPANFGRIHCVPDNLGGRFIYIKELFYCPPFHQNRSWSPDVSYEDPPEDKGLYRAYILEGSGLQMEANARVYANSGDQTSSLHYAKAARLPANLYPENILRPGYNFFIYNNAQLTGVFTNRKTIEELLGKYGNIVYHSQKAVKNTNYPLSAPAMWLLITERL